MVERVWQLPLKTLQERGIQGLIFDLDDTLAPKNGFSVDPKDLEWLKQARQAGLQFRIVSNNHHPAHVAKMAEVLQIPSVAQAKKPSSKYLLQALKAMNLRPQQVLMVGDRVLTDILGGAYLGMPTCLVKPVIPLRKKSLVWRWVYQLEWGLLSTR